MADAKAPWSPRMLAVMERLARAPNHTEAIGPGRDFQSALSLEARGDVKRAVYGEAPEEYATVTATRTGLAKLWARKKKPLIDVYPKKTPWPFPFSSRGLHTG